MLKTAVIALTTLTLSFVVAAGVVFAQSAAPLASPIPSVTPTPSASATPSASPMMNGGTGGTTIPMGAPATGLGGY